MSVAPSSRPAAPLPRRQPGDAPPVPTRLSSDLAMLLVCLIWGLNFSVTKLALAQIPPLPFTAVRFIISSLLLWLILRVAERGVAQSREGLTTLIVLGLVGNTLYQLLFTLGLDRTAATNSALILSTVPTVVAVFAGVLGLERITRRMWLGIALGTVGVVLVIATRGVGFEIGTLVGDLLTVLAVLCWAGYTVGLRKVPPGISPLRVTTITTIVGTPVLVLVGLPGMVELDWAAVELEAWAGLAYAAVLSLVVAYLLWNRSVKAVGGTRTAIYMCVTPLFAVIGAWVLLGERPHPLQGVGAVLIVAGVMLTRVEKSETPERSETTK